MICLTTNYYDVGKTCENNLNSYFPDSSPETDDYFLTHTLKDIAGVI